MRRNQTPYVCAYAAARVAMLALCCDGWNAPALAAQTEQVNTRPGLSITVDLIDSAEVAPGTRSRAEHEFEHIMQTAGISVAWIEGDANTPVDLLADAIVLRILPKAGPSDDPKALGVALAPGPGGIYATIFFDRVCERVADPVLSKAGARLEGVLGHAMAHEIGHLLLGMNSHSASGLMSAVWRVEDFRRLARGQFNFRPDEAARMRSEVARRNAQRRGALAKAH